MSVAIILSNTRLLIAICAARELRDLELRLPRNGLTQREGTALFTREDGSPISAANVDKLFKACLAGSGVARSTTAQYSPHSFRRYLACALKAQGAADSTIQALLRWKTAESLKLYSILNDESYADLIDGAGKADVSSVRTNSLPRAELLDVAGSFHAARVSLRTAAAAAEATAPEEDECVADSEAATSSDSSDGEQAPPPPPPVEVEVLLLRFSRGAPLAELLSPPGGPSLTLQRLIRPLFWR